MRLQSVAQRLVSSLSHGQQRQLEIGMALAGAPRLILFDEPAAGLSPGERRELVALLAALPEHMGFIIIEHDLDIALRVVEQVTVMHNGRVLKHGTPQRDRERRRGGGDLHGRRHGAMSWFSRRRVEGGPGPDPAGRPAQRLLRPRPRACRTSPSPWIAASWPSSAATAWARRRCATPSPAWWRPPAASSSAGTELVGLPPHAITGLGVGYVPQGRRVWPSLTVDEHLRLAERSAHRGVWTIERIYDLFPRLAERRGNGGYQLSGGEQQMLAIGRALLFNPRLLVMDEPTEGLAPVIVEQVAETLKSLGDDALSVLLVEQNLGVAIDVADTIAVMVNGRIARTMPAAELAADRDLQQRLLGVTTAGDVESDEEAAAEEAAPAEAETRIFTVRRANDDGAMPETSAAPPAPEERAVRGFTRWNAADTTVGPRDQIVSGRAEPVTAPPSLEVAAASLARTGRDARVVELPVATTVRPRRLHRRHLRHQGPRAGLPAQLPGEARACAPSRSISRPRARRRRHRCRRARWRGIIPSGERAVFTGDRGSAVTRDGHRLRALRHDAARPGRPHLRRRLGRHGARDAGRCARCRSASPR